MAGWALVRLSRRGRAIRVEPRLAIAILGVAALPTLASLASATAGVWDTTNAVRALFAVPLGATIGALVAAVVAKDLR